MKSPPNKWLRLASPRALISAVAASGFDTKSDQRGPGGRGPAAQRQAH